ncbi:MAG: helix-turn-helix domain-containing protein [Chloroflexi bacterium]|nr:helix-turn-helix domain-containing protein [Chloroflexota bacterium]
MDKKQLLLRLRRKKMGLLIADARQAAGRSINDCARAMGISQDQLKAIETGQHSPSLPELEAFSFYLNLPVEHFWGSQPYQPLEESSKEQTPDYPHTARDEEISQLLRARREEAGLSLEQLSQQTSLPLEALQTYEAGEDQIPVPELELIAQEIGLRVEDLIDPSSQPGNWRAQIGSARPLLELPDDVKKFISQPTNLPYIELAMRLSSLSSDRLRSIAEGILEITL